MGEKKEKKEEKVRKGKGGRGEKEKERENKRMSPVVLTRAASSRVGYLPCGHDSLAPYRSGAPTASPSGWL